MLSNADHPWHPAASVISQERAAAPDKERAGHLPGRSVGRTERSEVYTPRYRLPDQRWADLLRPTFVALSLRGIRASPSLFLFLVDGMSGLPHKWSMGRELRR